MEIKTISILGCGWFGLALAETLIANGYVVKGSTTSVEKLSTLETLGIKPYQINLNEASNLPDDFFHTDLLLINIPPKAKSGAVGSYKTKLESVVAAAEKCRVSEVVFISSTGIFQDGDTEFDESCAPNPDTESGRALQDAENLFRNNVHFRSTIIRFAGLIGPNRNLAKFFAGKTDIANGKAPINLITLQDCVGICLHLLQTQKFGEIYHAVVLHHPTRADFYTKLCEISAMAKPTFKDELLSWKQINSTNVPNKLGYQYAVKNWFQWMETSPQL